VRLVDEVLSSGVAVEPLLYAPERLASSAAGRALRQRLERLPTAEQIDEPVLATVSDTVTSQGVVGAVAIPRPVEVPPAGTVLVLDGVADPGNAGSMLRTARAAGAAAVIALPSTTDLWSPKAVRAGMGAHFHLAVHVDLAADALHEMLGQRDVWLATASEGIRYRDLDWAKPCAIVIGSEAHGTSSPVAAIATGRVRIPMAEGVESLNAAAAAAILLFAAQAP
jgi:RNA methyltransferase, TrmH family